MGHRTYDQSVVGDGRLAIAVAAILALVTMGAAAAQGFFYMEVEKDGRIYVFGQAKEYEAWSKSGEMGKSITRPGAGPNGETMIFDSEEAINLYNFKHGRPGEVMLKPEEKKPVMKFSRASPPGTSRSRTPWPTTPPVKRLPARRRHGRPAQLRHGAPGMVLEKNGEFFSSSCGAAVQGSPVNAVVWLANTLGALGLPFKAGEVILSGSQSALVPVVDGDELVCRIGGLGTCRARFHGKAAA